MSETGKIVDEEKKKAEATAGSVPIENGNGYLEPEPEEPVPEQPELEEVEEPKENGAIEKARRSGNMVKDFTNWTKHKTDADPVAQTVGGFMLTSLAVGRSPIVINPNPIYPNLMVLFLGKTRRTKKTSMMRLVTRVFMENQPKMNLGSDFSPEGLVKALEEHGQGVFIKDEVAGFLESLKKKDYMSGAKDYMCEFWDCPGYWSRVLASGRKELYDIYFNMMGATTPVKYKKNATLEDFLSGFLNKHLHVFMEPVPFSTPPPPLMANDKEKFDNCVETFEEIYEAFHSENKNRYFVPDQDALDYLYTTVVPLIESQTKVASEEEEEMVNASAEVMLEYILKFSADIEVNERFEHGGIGDEERIEISKKSVDQAIDLVMMIWKKSFKEVMKLIFGSVISQDTNKLKELITRHANPDGYALHSEVLHHSNWSSKQFREVMETARESGQIEAIMLKGKEGKKGRVVYKVLNNS